MPDNQHNVNFEETPHYTDLIHQDFQCSTIDGYCIVSNKVVFDPRLTNSAKLIYIYLRFFESIIRDEYIKNKENTTKSAFKYIYTNLINQDFNISNLDGFCKIPNRFLSEKTSKGMSNDEVIIYVYMRSLESIGIPVNLSKLSELSKKSNGHINRCLSILEKMGHIAHE